MYLRFRTSFLDDNRDKKYGVFQAAWFLLNSDTMYSYDQDRLHEIWQWFRVNLRVPHSYRQQKNTDHIICWFKPVANEHLQKMYEMACILEEYDLYVSQVKSHKPGYVVYEDDSQVAVIPFRELSGNGVK